jgi:hypothetical protein
VRKETLLYENLACDFFSSTSVNTELDIWEVAKEEQKAGYELVLPWGWHLGMKIWDTVELIEPSIGSYGKYEIIRNPTVYKLPSGIIESVSLFVKKIQNELQPDTQ